MDIKKAAIKSLWSKMGLKNIVSLAEFGNAVTQPCSFCGAEPSKTITYTRKEEGTFTLYWNYPMRDNQGVLSPLCPMCKNLLVKHGTQDVVSYCARVMARKLHGKLSRWYFPAPGKRNTGT